VRRAFLYTIISIFLSGFSASYAADMTQVERKIGDSLVTTWVTAKYTKSTTLNPLKIHVSTREGVVHLRGTVNNKDSFMEALRLAKSTKGVRSVNADELEIRSVNTPFTDAYITAKVEAAVLKAKVLDDESIPLVGINAKTVNGVVTLTGVLPSEKALLAIVRRVSKVRGVKEVILKLHVVKRSIYT